MKKLLSLMLAMLLFALPVLSIAEDDVIGGADVPTNIVLSDVNFMLPSTFGDDAIAAGRKGVTHLTVTEISGINTGDADMDAALTDLVKSLGLRCAAQGDEIEYAVSLSDVDVFNLGMATNGDDLYLKSDLLGDTIVISAAEMEVLLTRLLDMLVMMQTVSQADAEAMKEQISIFSASLMDAVENGSAALTETDLLSLDYSAITDVLMPLMAKVQSIESPVVPRNCDTPVGGVSVNVTNDEMLALIKSFGQFLKDNPKLMSYLGIADAQMLDEIFNTMLGEKVLDGDYVIHYYHDEAGMPVYVTCTLPMYFEQPMIYDAEVSAAGMTTVIEVVYSRQTVGQGVSHVVNISVDDEILTVDTFIGDHAMRMILSVPDEEPVLIQATIKDNTLSATLTANPNTSTAITCALEGSYLCTDTQYKLTGKFNFTEVYTPAETKAPSVNGLTLPGYEANKPKAHTNSVEVSIDADYERSGVDFTGVTNFLIAFNDAQVGVQAKSWTEESTDSIMAGDVVRPAELDDASFSDWFVQLVNNFGGWAGKLMMALPESLLVMILQGGMF